MYINYVIYDIETIFVHENVKNNFQKYKKNL